LYSKQYFCVEASEVLTMKSSHLMLACGSLEGLMATLGEELKRLRHSRGWTLREVEERTRSTVSNSYLYQLENDNVKEPSPNILYELSKVYDASYSALMARAGFVVPKSGGSSAEGNSIAFDALNLTEDEKNQVLDFVAHYLRRKTKKRSRR
jgi:HTH-type transcriptional regulator, competence development regulator